MSKWLKVKTELPADEKQRRLRRARERKAHLARRRVSDSKRRRQLGE